jgi:hypothetical protein
MFCAENSDLMRSQSQGKKTAFSGPEVVSRITACTALWWPTEIYFHINFFLNKRHLFQEGPVSTQSQSLPVEHRNTVPVYALDSLYLIVCLKMDLRI